MFSFIRVANDCCMSDGPALTHSILTATFFFHLLKIFIFTFQFLSPKHDCHIKFTSCST